MPGNIYQQIVIVWHMTNENKFSHKHLKFRLQKKYGSLRAASKNLGINYYRLSQIVNEWIEANAKEQIEIVKALKNSRKLGL
jgi:molybdenum-dependent DNA-binding transcriptional regulator ModE